MLFGTKTFIFVCIRSTAMSKEVLEFSVLVEEKFDVNFNLVEGLLGWILKIFGR